MSLSTSAIALARSARSSGHSRALRVLLKALPRAYHPSTSIACATRCKSTLAAGARAMPPPLAGINIVDLTRVLAGPTATMLLADLGADVIKIEEVKRGDDTRAWNPPSAPIPDTAPSEASHLPPESTYFLSANRNKRSCTINFKHPEGLKVLHDLIRQADVLVENYVPGKLAEMGLGWEDCQRLNEKLIYASISGYGQTGPFAKAPGYDVVIEAEAGLMHITGEPTGPPNKVGVAVTDISTGLYVHGAILAALLSRSQTGLGVHIDANLFETQLAGLANVASAWLVAGKEGARHGTSHPSIVPYQVFPCGGGGYLMLGAGNDRQFEKLARNVLGMEELCEDERFRTNALRVKHREELVGIITDELMKEDREHWLKAFTGQGIPFGPINNIEQSFAHPQAVARGITVEVEHERAGSVKMVAPAVSYNGKRMPVTRPPPWLSQHTEEVLTKDLGYSTERFKELRALGVV